MSEHDEPPANSADAGGSHDTDSGLTPEATGVHHSLQGDDVISPPLLDSEADARRAELMTYALRYASSGLAVIPVRWVDETGHCACPNGADCPSPAKHPVHDSWPDVATVDEQVIRRWWREEPPPGEVLREWFPFANIGIVTGRKSGVFVLDVDTYAGGMQTLGNYERRNGPLPETRVHTTGGGGTHYFFAHPGFDVRNSAERVLGTGLDVRGERGFVVAPPSISGGERGGLYELNPAHDIDPVPAPEWLLDILRSHDKGQQGTALSGAMPTKATGVSRRYVEAAVKGEVARMRETGPGTHNRNETLNECAFALGQLGGAGLLSEDAAYSALREAALAAGLGETEIRATFMSGWKAGMKDPRQVPMRQLGADWPTRPMNEFGLADRMADHLGDVMRYCPDWNTWLRYHGGVWLTDVKDAGEWAAQAMIRSLEHTEALSYEETPDIDKDGATELPSPRARFLAWLEKIQNRKSVSAAARLAQGVPLMRMSQSTFDLDPGVLNVRNGVVDLATGELRPHSPEDRMTLQCRAAYVRGVSAPQWRDFLERVQPDPEMRAYLQRMAGYCLTGLTREQVFFLGNGTGANGKSVFQNVIAAIMGSYAQVVPTETLMASSVDGRIPNDVARMRGKRLLIASETRAGRSFDETRLKALTGGDIISARYMRAEWFDFEIVGKILVATNHLPKMSDDAAIWRRIHLLSWGITIPEHERDGDLQRRLIAEEAEGILSWMVDGAIAWYRDGLQPPETVIAAREAYRQDEDVVAQFINECLDEVNPVPGALNRDVRAIYSAYQSWATDNKLPVMGQRNLTSRLKVKYPGGYKRSNSWAGFPGLQVRQHFGPPADDEVMDQEDGSSA